MNKIEAFNLNYQKLQSGVILGPFSVRLEDAALRNFPEKMPFPDEVVIFNRFLMKKYKMVSFLSFNGSCP